MSLMDGSIQKPIFIEEEHLSIFPVTGDQMAPAKATKEKEKEKKPKKEKAPPKEKKPKEPKVKGVKSKKNGKIERVNASRGLPAKAARLVSSNYATFGWHKTLSESVSKVAKDIGPEVNAMYLLQMKRDNAVGSLSMRNAVFYEHKQLSDPLLISTPAIDHVDLFSDREDTVRDVMDIIKIKRPEDGKNELHMHYFFKGMREREFLLWPILINDVWITFFARLEACGEVYRDITDFTLVDPWPENRKARRKFVLIRLAVILRQAKIRMNFDVARSFQLEDVELRWQTGYVSWAVSREFMRRLSKLLWYRNANPDTTGDDFLWGDFEELYNFDSYRESMMMACALQSIRKSGYMCRIGIEAPSEDCLYYPEKLRPLREDVKDEKWHSWETDAKHIEYLNGSPSPYLEGSSAASPKSVAESYHESIAHESRVVSPVPSQENEQQDVAEENEEMDIEGGADQESSPAAVQNEDTTMEDAVPETQVAQDMETEPNSPEAVMDEAADEPNGEAIDEPTETVQAAPIPDMGGPSLSLEVESNQIPTPSFNDSTDCAQIPGLHLLRRSASPSPPSEKPSEVQPEETPTSLLAPPRSPVLVGVTPTFGLSPHVSSGEQSEAEDDAGEAEAHPAITPAQAIAQSAVEVLWRKELGPEKRERDEDAEENEERSPKRVRVEDGDEN
ncbi:hypothetical protein GGR57DRAFT_154297 [Xylariaceae sp. FL1272]|nr:hypothetical protein GGR57DRAFT_154297 [Xylariaceae sp. FL1272]